MNTNYASIIMLLNNDESISLSEIEKITKIKKTAILKIINDINNDVQLNGCYIESQRGKGYRLIINEKVKFVDLFRRLNNINQLKVFQQIFLKLIDGPEYTPVKFLEDELYLSRTKVTNEIEKLNVELLNYQLCIDYVRFEGYKLIGSETMIRKYIFDNKLDDSQVNNQLFLKKQVRSMYMTRMKNIQKQRSESFALFEKKSELDEIAYLKVIEKQFDLQNAEKEKSISFITLIKDKYNLNIDDEIFELLLVEYNKLVYFCQYEYVPLDLSVDTYHIVGVNVLKDFISYNNIEISIGRQMELTCYLSLIIQDILFTQNFYDDVTNLDFVIYNKSNTFKAYSFKKMLGNLTQKKIEIVDSIDSIRQMPVNTIILNSEVISTKELECVKNFRRINLNYHERGYTLDEIFGYIVMLQIVDDIRNKVSLEYGLADDINHFILVEKKNVWRCIKCENVNDKMIVDFKNDTLIIGSLDSYEFKDYAFISYILNKLMTIKLNNQTSSDMSGEQLINSFRRL